MLPGDDITELVLEVSPWLPATFYTVVLTMALRWQKNMNSSEMVFSAETSRSKVFSDLTNCCLFHVVFYHL
jgi:hypothetical protein